MIDYSYFLPFAEKTVLSKILPGLMEHTRRFLKGNRFGDRIHWYETLAQLPVGNLCDYNLNSSIIHANHKNLSSPILEDKLKALMPWRKGPFQINDILIDTEWRSDLKWNRLIEYIEPLDNKVVLDVGCGNGYHLFRMLGHNARIALGIDPMLFYICQFFAIKHFLPHLPTTILPLTLDHFPQDSQVFDTVFSMGVLYHRRSPVDHLNQLKHCLKPGGQLVLETLVVDGNNTCLIPHSRYAKMNNVWFLPSTDILETLLFRLNFKEVQVVDINMTQTSEQRATDWMHYESLSDFLDPEDPRKTIEGYQAPTRAIIIARR